MPLYDQTTLPLDVDQVRTINNATKNQDTDQALTREGLGGKASTARDVEWKTTITWDPIEPDTKDGTGVEATVLGPDHKAGETPDKSIYVCPNVIGLNELAGLESNKGYVKGHLLNEKLGGPGNDNRNLTAIPRATNTGGMKDHVEERLKTLVNTNRAWVYFKAKVKHTTVPKKKKAKQHTYASKLDFWWHELKDDGTGKAVKVDGTEGTVMLDVPPPDEYADTDYSQATNTTTYGVEKTGKTSAVPDTETAIADLPWNAIVLQDWDTAKKRSEMIKIAATEIEQLGASDAKKMIDYLTEAHSSEETDLFQWIEKEVERLEADERAAPSDQLGDKLDAYDQARTGRIGKVADEVAQFLTDKRCPDAVKRGQEFRDELGKHDPLASHRKLATELLKRNQQLGKDKGELQDRVIDFSLGFETPMSPYSEWWASEQLDPSLAEAEEQEAEKQRQGEKEQDKGSKDEGSKDEGSKDETPPKIDMDRRRKRVREEVVSQKSSKASKDLVGHKPTYMAQRCMYIFDKLREGKKLPDGFVAIGFIDGLAFKLLSSYILADNELHVRDVIWPWLRGLEKDRPGVFVAIARALHSLPSLAELATEAGLQSF